MSVVGDIIGDITGSDKAADAAREGAALSAKSTIEATEKNIDFQKWLWGEQKELQQPFVDAGEEALGDYMGQVSSPYTMDDLYMDPGYNFRMQEGQKALETSAAARGMQLSGPQRKALARYGQNYASGEFQNAFSRRQTGLDNLYRMIVGGQSAAAGQATTGGQMGSQISNAIQTGGAANAQMYSDFGNIGAQQAMAPWNTLMDVGGLAATYYGGK